MDISAIRKMRSTDFASITKAVEAIASPQTTQRDSDDERLWKPTQDKVGNASAVIRFLARTEGDTLPWVKIIDHGFQGPTGRWYIEKSLSTIDKADPCGELNGELWNNGTEAGKEQARKQKRRTSYYANILVVNDPADPSANGTVRIFKFGKKIMEKIMDKAKPTFEDEKPVNVFDYWEGANFKLRMKKVEGYPNYDASVFGPVEAISEDDEEILAIAKQQAKLSEFLDESKFKTYDELKKKLQWVLNTEAPAAENTEPVSEQREMKAAEPKLVASKPAPKTVSFDDDDADDFSIEKFRALAGD